MNEFYEEIDEVLHSSDVAKGDARCDPGGVVCNLSYCKHTIVKSMLTSHQLCG